MRPAKRRLHRDGILSEFAARSECSIDRSIAGYWFCEPALPLAISSAVRVFLDRPRQPPFSDQHNLSPGFAFLQSLERTSPSPPAAAGKHLSWAFAPYSTSGLGDPLTRGLPHPATVRLQGLVTLLTAFARRGRARLVSSRQRSWDSPFGAFSSQKVADAFPHRSDPHTVSPVGVPEPHKATWTGPTSRGSWALTLPEVPGDKAGISSPAAGCSLGFPLSGQSSASLASDSAPAPPACFAGHQPYDQQPAGTSESQSALAWPHPLSPGRSRTDGRGNPHRVLTPGKSRPFEQAAIRAMCSPHAASHVAADQPAFLGWSNLALPESPEIA
jgi:hypothetical protein